VSGVSLYLPSSGRVAALRERVIKMRDDALDRMRRGAVEPVTRRGYRTLDA